MDAAIISIMTNLCQMDVVVIVTKKIRSNVTIAAREQHVIVSMGIYVVRYIAKELMKYDLILIALNMMIKEKQS